MDNCLAKCVQVKEDVDNGNEIGHSTEDCLHNPIIVRKILENFSGPQLFKLSLVNKLWKYEARSVLAERGRLTAHVKSHDLRHRPTAEIEAFVSDLQEMNPVPYSGISLNIYFDSGMNASAAQEPDPLQGVILVQPWLKTVSVTLQAIWPENFNCSAALLTKKVLQDCYGFLEELELSIYSGREHFMKHVLQDFTFPRLRILKLSQMYSSPHDVRADNYVKELLSRAPNLKVLHSNWSINSMLRILEGSSIQPVFGFLVAPFEGISENVFSKIQLESIRLQYTGPQFNLERFNRITPLLLQQSCTSALREVRLDAVLAIPLMTYGICLENVDDLHIEIAYDYLELMEPRILRIVKNFNYSFIFPNLNKVSIGCDSTVLDLSQDHMNAMIDRANAIPREPMPDRAAGVKELGLHYWYPSRVAAQFYFEMHPSIEKLEITTSQGGQIPFGSIWRNWLELKEFQARGHLLPTTENLDSIFCGIFPEEVAELRLKDEEYLKEVNIVPVMPAITCLKNLRTLSLHHEHYRRDLPGDDATFMFSKVAALIAFARQPALEVTLIISGCSVPPVMDHLTPYMSVSTQLDDDSA